MDKEEMEHSLAYEMLTEVKASAKRWFIAFCIMTGLEIATICGFMWYMSLPVEETTDESINQESDGNDNQLIGGDYNSGEADDKAYYDKEESSESSQRQDN